MDCMLLRISAENVLHQITKRFGRKGNRKQVFDGLLKCSEYLDIRLIGQYFVKN